MKRVEVSREFYGALYDRYGDDPRAFDWSGEESQWRRFEVLAEIGLREAGTVLDVGCGTGDLCRFFRQRGYRCAYTGIDICQGMLAAAREKNPDGTFWAVAVEKLHRAEEYDFVLASGTFNIDTGRGHWGYVRRGIEQMWALCRVGVAFNLTSAWADEKAEHTFWADPLKTFDFCRKLSRYVVLRHDYMPHDFTVYVYREALP